MESRNFGEVTFADILRGEKQDQGIQQSTPPSPPHILPTHLQVDNDMERWIQKSTLIGETMSLSHLGHLPALMAIHSDITVDVK